MTRPSANTGDAPKNWYNILADIPFELPPDIPPPARSGQPDAMKLQLPLALVRQSMTRERLIPIPEPVFEKYLSWRPTPLRRARAFEQHIGTRARIYYKYEGGNASGSHKLCSAVAQAHYYAAAGAQRLVTGTGAGQWGTALAVACQQFGLACKVYMVAKSFREKPYRQTIMRMYDAEVVPSPHPDAAPSARRGEVHAENIAYAVTEAFEDALAHPGTQLSVGSGEAYSILHSTVVGQEAREQLGPANQPDIVIGSLGAGSNFGGIAMPFIGAKLRGEAEVRCIAVEAQRCPKLTRGRYCYDYTDGSGVSPLQKMYTLGSRFTTAGGHVGGLRYHACSKIISALYHHRIVEALAYPQLDVFASGVLFSRLEGILPAPESAHAIHAAIELAKQADAEGAAPVILFCLSGHGLFDLASYEAYLNGTMQDMPVSDEEIRRSLAQLPQLNG
ncbi:MULTISPECIES: TrpB-like pyridoxal phosphate-dependent enzyme [unclassified Nocardia]|uniref:TrpB-like pyridoxal phosphate-dependent enzyme n=1 Tax=unclassified Nocardia TaxID=2637762 RepID=UPI001CE4B160|nr:MULTISPECIES: TrpB-like pyridoxal phosphate-dependent enzyme [unclassified Nocardia]